MLYAHIQRFSLLLLVKLFLFGSVCYSQDLIELERAIKFAEQKNDTLELSRSWYKLGIFHDKNGHWEESNHSLAQALIFAQSIHNHKGIAVVANYLASNYSQQGQSDSSIAYYSLALKAGVEYGDSSRLPIILMNLGDEYASRGEFINAANYAISAIRIKEHIQDSSNLAFFYQKLGEIYKQAGEKEKWEKYIWKAYKLVGNENYTSIKANAAIYNDLGGIAEGHGEPEQALLYYDTLIQIGEKNDYPLAIGIALGNSASIFKQQGNIDRALNSVLKSKEYIQKKGYAEIYDNNLLSELYLAKGNKTNALKYALQAVNHKSIDYNPEEKVRAYKSLYEIEKRNGNFENALFWNENFKQLSDSIRDKEIRTQILDLEISYQTEKKEKQIELLEAENRIKNERLKLGAILVIFLMLLIATILYVLRIRKNQARLKQNDLQQQVLRAQMNPHFIFNVLGSIQNFMIESDIKKAAGYLANFASLIRSTLQYSTSETISLADEIQMLKNYVELERIRDPEKFRYKFEMDDTLESEFIQIPPMMIQPFLENAIKHGFQNSKKSGELTIKVVENEESIEFIIEDNGVGLGGKKKETAHHQSMAMNIFIERRKLIQKKIKKEFKYEIINRHDVNPDLSGVLIKVNLPILHL